MRGCRRILCREATDVNTSGYTGERYLLKGIVLGTAYLHANMLIHRAISSRAVQVDYDGGVRLGGLSNAVTVAKRKLGDLVVYRNNCEFQCEQRQLPWIAPEYLRQDITGYTAKADVFSIGMVAVELTFGATPYDGLLPSEIFFLKVQDPTGPLGECPRLAARVHRPFGRM